MLEDFAGALLGALIGALAAFVAVRRTEAADLRVQVRARVYDSMSDALESVGDALIESRSTLHDVKRHLTGPERDRPEMPTFQDVEASHRTAMRAAFKFHRTIERYEIVFLHMTSARLKFFEAQDQLRDTFWSCFRELGTLLPMVGADGTRVGPAIAEPSDEQEGAAVALVDEHLVVLERIRSYILDFQIEAQNLLLGESFPHEVPRRNPKDEADDVLLRDPRPMLSRPEGRFVGHSSP